MYNGSVTFSCIAQLPSSCLRNLPCSARRAQPLLCSDWLPRLRWSNHSQAGSGSEHMGHFSGSSGVTGARQLLSGRHTGHTSEPEHNNLPSHQHMLDINSSLSVEHSLSGYELILVFLTGALVQCVFQIIFNCILGES